MLLVDTLHLDLEDMLHLDLEDMPHLQGVITPADRIKCTTDNRHSNSTARKVVTTSRVHRRSSTKADITVAEDTRGKKVVGTVFVQV